MQITLRNNKSACMLPQLTWKANILMCQFENFSQMLVIRIKALFNQTFQIDIIVPMATHDPC
ncbi:hypothetical protein D3C81_987550 [compost metagenome]